MSATAVVQEVERNCQFFSGMAHLTAGTVIDTEDLPHVAVYGTAGVFLGQLRDGLRMRPCQLLHQPFPVVLALIYRDESGHTPDHTDKVGIHIAFPCFSDDVEHFDVALITVLLVQFVYRFDTVDLPRCPDAIIGEFHTGVRCGTHKVKCIRVSGY